MDAIKIPFVKVPNFHLHDIKVNDPHMTLIKWEYFIRYLIEQFGPNSILYTDAGYNNTTMYVKEPLRE